MDRGAWWAAVYVVAQSRTRLTRLSRSSILFILRRKGNYLIIFILLIRVPHFWNIVIYSVSYTVAKKKKNLTVLSTGQTLTTYVFIFYWIYTVVFPLKSSRFYERTFKQQTLFQHNEPDSVSYRKQNIISLARKESLTRNKPSPIYKGKMPKEGHGQWKQA